MLKQKALFSFITNIASSVLGLVSVFFVAKFMGPEPLGIVNTTLAFASLFILLGDLGFGLAHIKRVSEGMDMKKCIATFRVIKLGLTLLMGVVTLLVLYLTRWISGKYPFEAQYLDVFYIVFISVLLSNYYNYIQITFAAKVEKAKEGAVLLSNRFTNTFLRTLVAVSGLTVIYLAWSTLAAALISILLSIVMFKSYPRSGKFDKEVFRSYRSYAIPSAAISITSIVLVQLDKVLLAFFSNSIEVGYYTGAQGFVFLLTFIGSLFISLLLPTYSAMFTEGKIQEIKSLANRVEKYISLLLMPIAAFIIFFADNIRVLVLGSEFAPSSMIIAVLCAGSVFTIFSQPYSTQLLAANRIKLSVRIGVIVLVSDVVFNILLVPETLAGIQLAGMGGLGAAVSMALATFIGALVSRYYAFKTTASKPNYAILLHLLIGTIVFGILYLMNIRMETNVKLLWTLPLVFLTGFLVYIFLLFILKAFKRSDISFYLAMVNPGLMKNYLTSELRTKK